MGEPLQDGAEHDVVGVRVVVDRARRCDRRHGAHEVEHFAVGEVALQIRQYERLQLLPEIVAEVAHSAAVAEQHRDRDAIPVRPVRDVPVDRVVERELVRGDQLVRDRSDEELRHAAGQELAVDAEGHAGREAARQRVGGRAVSAAQAHARARRLARRSVPRGDGIESRATHRRRFHTGARCGVSRCRRRAVHRRALPAARGGDDDHRHRDRAPVHRALAGVRSEPVTSTVAISRACASSMFGGAGSR